MVEKWNSVGGTVWWNSFSVTVEPWKSDSGTVWVEQCGGTVLVEQ